jgi:hypothetical protein
MPGNDQNDPLKHVRIRPSGNLNATNVTFGCISAQPFLVFNKLTAEEVCSVISACISCLPLLQAKCRVPNYAWPVCLPPHRVDAKIPKLHVSAVEMAPDSSLSLM